MSDGSRRELERRWRETGTVEDEARFLRARLRLGELSRPRLELLAWLGHAPAAEALGSTPPAGEHVDWRAWGRELDAQGGAIVVRAQLESLFREDTLVPRLFSAAADAARAWCERPDAERLREVEAAYVAVRPAADALLDQEESRRTGRLLQVSELVGHLARHPEAAWAWCLDRVLRDEHGVSPALRQELVGWALGEGHAYSARGPEDPVAAEARFLAHRLRQGQLDLEALRLAAYASAASAEQALREEGQLLPEVPAQLGAWLIGLGRWSRSLAVQTVLVVAKDVYYGPEEDLRETGGLRQLVGTLAAGDLVEQAQDLVQEAEHPIFRGRHALDLGDEDVSVDCGRIAAELAGMLRSARWRLLPKVQRRLAAWVDVLRVWQDLERAARSVALLAEAEPVLSPHWSVSRARQHVIDYALRVAVPS